MDEVVYVLGTTVPGLVCRSHANRSICAVTPFFNPESPPLLPCTGSGINEKPRVREGSGRLLLRLDSNQ